jgi:hypothetical protein
VTCQEETKEWCHLVPSLFAGDRPEPRKEGGWGCVSARHLTSHQTRTILSNQMNAEFNLNIALNSNTAISAATIMGSSDQHVLIMDTVNDVIGKFFFRQNQPSNAALIQDETTLTSSIRRSRGRRQSWRVLLLQQVGIHCCSSARHRHSSGIGLLISPPKAAPHLCTSNILEHFGRCVCGQASN